MKLSEFKYYCTENLVFESPYFEISQTCRLYYFMNGCGGFYFCGLTMEQDTDWLVSEDVFYFFSGSACFDGVRHMFMSCDDEMDRGYQNYPQLDLIIKFFTQLDRMQNDWCSDFGGRHPDNCKCERCSLN